MKRHDVGKQKRYMKERKKHQTLLRKKNKMLKKRTKQAVGKDFKSY